jgi:hypothetical protein
MLRSILLILAVSLPLPGFAGVEGDPANNMGILRDKVTADKKFVVANNMNLTESEAKAFWPVYEAYQQDMRVIDERLAKVIDEYAAAYNQGPVPDSTATKLIEEAIGVEMAEVKLKQSYVPKLSKVLPGAKVARYLQIESKIRAITRFELASAIPLVD